MVSSNVNSAFYHFEVDQMNYGNSWGISGTNCLLVVALSVWDHVEVDVTKSCKTRKKQQMLETLNLVKDIKKVKFQSCQPKNSKDVWIRKVYRKLILASAWHILSSTK